MSTDRLTQLQDTLDQLLTQMFATITYIDTHHSPAHIPGQADQWTPSGGSVNPSANAGEDGGPAQPSEQENAEDRPPTTKEPRPEPQPEIFRAKLKELAQDLVLKEQQIEALIEVLPGLGTSEAAQEKRLKELELELKEVDAEEKQWEEERRKMLGKVDGWVKGSRVRRV